VTVPAPQAPSDVPAPPVADADVGLGAPFLRSVLHDAPDRLLGVPGQTGRTSTS
jgi:hypothetical protein